MWKYSLILAAVVAQPAMAQDASPATDMDGIRAEIRIGYETPTISGDDEVYKIGNSASIGAEVGYDAAISQNVTAGVFANYEYAESKTCDGGFCLGSKGNLQGGVRLGLRTGDNIQVYLKAGYNRMKLEASQGGQSGTESLDGFMGAIGFDYAFSPKAYAGLEIDYADLGSLNGVNFQRRHVAAKVGTRF